MDLRGNSVDVCPRNITTAVLELEDIYRESQADPSFQSELNQLLRQYMWDVKRLLTTQNWPASAEPRFISNVKTF